MKALIFTGKQDKVEEEKESDPKLKGREIDKRDLCYFLSKGVADPRSTKILELLNKCGFWEAPASSRKEFHGCYPGGLSAHTLAVIKHMLSLNDAWECGISEESIVVAGIIHDISKAGVDGKPYYILDSSKAVPTYKSNKELPSMGQNALSLWVAASNSIPLTLEETEAVMGQDGLYSDESKSVFDHSSRSPGKLTFVLHYSDFYVSSVHKV